MPFAPPPPAPSGSPKNDPSKQLFRLAARLQQVQDPVQRQRIRNSVGRALSGFSQLEIARAGAKANLSPADISALQTFSKRHQYGGPQSPLSANPLDIAQTLTQLTPLQLTNLPGQAVLGGITEGGTGALKGLTGAESYSPVEAFARGVLGKTPAQALKYEQGLNPLVRSAANFGGAVVTDPTSYATFGTSAVARAGARSAAENIAVKLGRTAAEDVGSTLSEAGQQILGKLMQGGKGALSKEERQAFRDLPGMLRRKAVQAQGGMRIAGVQVPFTKGIGRAVGTKQESGLLGTIEQVARPRGGLHIAERAGQVAPGTTQDVENVLASLKGAGELGKLREQQALKAARPIYGRLAAGRLNEGELGPVREALDVGATPALTAQQSQLAKSLRGISEEDLAALQQAGRLGTTSIEQSQYMQHVLTPEAAAQERRTGQVGVTLPGRPAGFLQQREGVLPASQYRLSEGPNAGKPVFELDPRVAFGVHARQTAQEVGRVNAFRDLGNLRSAEGTPLLVTHPDEVAALGNATDRYVKVKAPIRENLAGGGSRTVDQEILVDRTIANDWKNVAGVQAGTPAGRRALDSIKYVNALWSRYATGSLGFISRNVLQGNLYMGMVLAEARNPLDWARSLGTMFRLSEGIRRFGNPFALVKSEEERALIQGAIANNAVESNFMSLIEGMAHSTPARSRLGRWATQGKTSPFSPNFAPLKGFADANAWVESWSRLAVYANKIRQGLNPADAAAITRHYMIDYTDLGQIGRGLKYVNPFITWTYKTAPLMIGEFLHNPRKVTIPVHLIDAIAGEGEQKGVTPDWVRQSGGFTLPKGVREHLPFGLNKNPVAFVPDTPLQTAQDVLQPALTAAQAALGVPGADQEAARQLVNLLGAGGVSGGLPKAIIETATGSNLFTGQRVEPGQQLETPSPLSLIPGFPKKLPASLVQQLNSLLPNTSRLSTIAPQSKYEREARARRILSAITGINLYPLTKRSQQSELYRRLSLLQAQQRALETGGGKKVPQLPKALPPMNTRR